MVLLISQKKIMFVQALIYSLNGLEYFIRFNNINK